MRIVRLLDKDTLLEVKDIDFNDIKKGDIFRLYDDENSPVKYKDTDETILYAWDDAQDHRVNCINYKSVLEKEVKDK